MSKRSKTICGWENSDLKAKHLLKVLENPRFFCQDCGRAANKKKRLCLPKKLYKHKE